jgi:hypothetical protein
MCWWPNLARLEKPNYPVSNSELSGFGSFQNRNREGVRLEDLKIKGILRLGKILKGDKEPMEKNFKPKAKIAKTGMSGFGNQDVQFL